MMPAPLACPVAPVLREKAGPEQGPPCCLVHSAGRPAVCFSVQSPSHADTCVKYNKNKCLRKARGQGIAANAQMLILGFCASLVLTCNTLSWSGVHLNPTLRNAHSKGGTAQVRGEQSRAARGKNEGPQLEGAGGLPGGGNVSETRTMGRGGLTTPRKQLAPGRGRPARAAGGLGQEVPPRGATRLCAQRDRQEATGHLAVAGGWTLLSPWWGTMAASTHAKGEKRWWYSNPIRTQRKPNSWWTGRGGGESGSVACSACLVWDKN